MKLIWMMSRRNKNLIESEALQVYYIVSVTYVMSIKKYCLHSGKIQRRNIKYNKLLKVLKPFLVHNYYFCFSYYMKSLLNRRGPTFRLCTFSHSHGRPTKKLIFNRDKTSACWIALGIVSRAVVWVNRRTLLLDAHLWDHGKAGKFRETIWEFLQDFLRFSSSHHQLVVRL